MTKAEYEVKYEQCNNWHGNISVCKEYIASLEAENARLEKLFACAYETLAELSACPHEVYGFKSTKHNCNECDSVNAETCFCWKDWIEAKIAKEEE